MIQKTIYVLKSSPMNFVKVVQYKNSHVKYKINCYKIPGMPNQFNWAYASDNDFLDSYRLPTLREIAELKVQNLI